MQNQYLKKYMKNIIFIFIISLMIYVSVLLSNDYQEIVNILNDVNWIYILISVFILIICFLIDSKLFQYFISIFESYKYIDAFKLILATNFFNGVTPFATGGQPYQLYVMTEQGIKGSNASSAMMMNYIVGQIGLLIVGLTAIIFKLFYFYNINNSVGYMVILGFILNSILIIGTYLVLKSKRIKTFVLEKLLLFLKKIKVIKKYDEVKEKYIGFLNNFHNDFNLLTSNKIKFVIVLTISSIRRIIQYTVPVFIFLSMGINVENIVNLIIVAALFSFLILSIIPTPGSSGGAEVAFKMVYSTFISSVYVVSAIIIWRFITYYLVMIIGFIGTLIIRLKKVYNLEK